LKGIRRQEVAHQDSAAPLLLVDFQAMLDAISGEDPLGVRNRALLSTAFFGAFRRSEVVGLQLPDLRIREEGMIVGLRHSKTNQGGAGEDKAIARGPQGSPYCPVQLVEQWLTVYAGRADEKRRGPVFPALDRAGNPQPHCMTPENFYYLFKRALRRAGFDPEEYSPHSLRSGFITSAYLAGKDPFKIKRISGHRSQTTFERYLHEADRFQSNASDLL
jgi:integrase